LEKVLIARIELTTHFGLSGVKQFLNSKFDSDLVPADDSYDAMDSTAKRLRAALPGVVRGDMKSAPGKKIWRVNGLAVSPDGQEMAVATSEGAFMLSLGRKSGEVFAPTNLTEEVSVGAVLECLKSGDFKRACLFSLQLNDFDSFNRVFTECDSSVQLIQSVVASIPPNLLLGLLTQIYSLIHPVHGTFRIERALVWLSALVELQFKALQVAVHQTNQGREIRAMLLSVLQHIQTQSSALGSVLKQNSFLLSVLAKPVQDEEEETVDEDQQHTRLEDVMK
jgi:hypothetical protein